MYIGTVVDNDDPLKMGRVKVYIPSLHSVQLSDKTYSVSKFIGANVEGDLQTIIDLVGDSLPWALPSLPVVDGGGIVKHDKELKLSTVSEHAKTPNDYFLPPKRNYEADFRARGRAFDGFINPINNCTRKANMYGYAYTNDTHSSASKGIYSIPAIGTKLLLSGLEGKNNNLIYFNQVPTDVDMRSIYDREGSHGDFKNYK